MTPWTITGRPLLIMAPLEGVTDTVFRRIIASCARPDVFFTEFTSADGLCSVGKDRVLESFRYTAMEQPLIAQLWGRNPDTMRHAAELAASMGFAGVDINMGCPDRSVMAHGAGAALVGDAEAAGALIRAAQDGIRSSGMPIPVSVKTRISTTRHETDSWVSFLLASGIHALTIHARTAKDLSKVPARWDEIASAVRLRDASGAACAIIGNGDVPDAIAADTASESYGADGVMIGRGIFQNPWAFDRVSCRRLRDPSEYLALMERHILLFHETWGMTKNFAILRKFFKIYIGGFRGAVAFRDRAMRTESAEEAMMLIAEIRSILSV